MRISDWSSDVCSSDLVSERQIKDKQTAGEWHLAVSFYLTVGDVGEAITVRSYDAPASGAKARVKAEDYQRRCRPCCAKPAPSVPGGSRHVDAMLAPLRSEEHTSALQSLISTSYAVFCLKRNNHR